MGHNLRSLLLAAIIISNCITWTASRHHYTHNVSGHRSRHRRQGAGLYLPASHVLPGGEGGGAWGEWGEVSPCSRTCGGGVASQKRICLEVGPDGKPLCRGGDTKYFSCQTQDCPGGASDFRAEQCSEYDDESFRGVKYRWVPYTKGPNPCELNCMPRSERFYYRHKLKVIDGTRCDEDTFDVCVDGTCQPVGCDMMLGSTAREDKCRECRGNNTNCHTVTGVIDPDQDLRRGYNDLILIPEGATNIYIAEVRDSSNYLALRSKTNNKYYLNGDYHIDFPRRMLIAGVYWQYERSQQGFAAPDKLSCLGPTTEPLYLSILLQDDNVGIEYEYSIPSSLAPPPNQQYNWVHDDFTPCSTTCGGGFQTRDVTCRSREELEVVDDSLCDSGLKPATNVTCNTQPCAARWVEGPWSPCTKPCGEGGSRSRQVHCEKIISNGLPSVVPDKECFELLGPKPELYQECNKDAICPMWYTGPWKPCDKLCGEGKQTRQVVCYQKTNGRVEVLTDYECADEKPPAEQPCILHPCEGVDWVISDWTGCDSCLSTIRTRTAVCSTKDKEVVNSTFCSYHPTPELEEPCDKNKLPACEVQWYSTQWSNCSVQCGKGIKTRRVFCGLFDGSSVLKVDDNRCNNDSKYNDTKSCEVPPEKCPAKWFAGPWSECTKECGGGEQFRKVMCLSGGKEAGDCDGELVLDSTQACNSGPCNEDEMMPVDSKSTPIMDEDLDEEECEDEDYSDVGAAEDLTSTTLEDELMFSDSPSTEEGSGTGSTSFTDIESEFTDTTDTGSGSEPTVTESLITESSGTGPTEETMETGSTETEETGSTESTETTESGGTSESGGTTESSGTSESGATEETSETSDSTGTTESSGSSESSGTSDSSITTESGTSESDTSGSTESSESSTTELSSETTGSSETTDISSSTSEASSTTETSDTSDASSTTESGTTESGSTDSSTTESGSTESGSTETSVSGSTDETTESGSTESSGGSTTESGTESTDTTESGATVTTDTTESGGTTESGSTETGSTDTGSTDTGSTDTGSTDTGSTDTGSTDTGSTDTGSTETSETGTTESGMTSETEETESTLEGSSTTEFSTSDESTETEESTPWGWSSTLFTNRPRRCKPKKKAKCVKSHFGCCPDKITPAAGPFDEGCPNPKTCKESKFDCCPDGVSPATGPKNHGCPTTPCNETLYGCCKSDKKTAAGGNDQEGCPPPPPACKSSKYGCCKDEKTAAKGPKKKGCPETETKKIDKKKGCAASKFGCCFDKKTNATGPNEEGCPCDVTEFGCCPDGVSPARGTQMEGCIMSCNTSAHGCCPDGETPAHGPGFEGCCLLYSFGCCPDNYRPAEGPHLEGCGCQYAHYGCCPDNVTISRGPDNEGCGCQYTEHGCCPDRHTEATGPEFEGCDCHTYQFGCCPDGSTVAKGPNLQGCHCQQSKHGCCGDGQTAAIGPDMEGCDCSSSKYGCCPDGQTDAKGAKFLGCTDMPENKQIGCGLAIDRGSCRNYSVYWYYDIEYGGCSRFWYGGCEGNGNRFSSKEECEDICVQPPPKDACKLPKVKGACLGYHLRWYYDNEREQCGQFIFGGCLGNANNYETQSQCQEHCEPAKSDDQCKLPIERGSCAGNFGRWGFNSETRRCEQFIWGGCEGNNNRFGSEAACVMRCDPPGQPKPECSEPQEVGNCTEKVAKWSFSQTENRCVPFYYTGCGGNGNKYDSLQDCEQSCPSVHVQDICTLPALTGECADYREKWYYDTSNKRCRQFYFGGCGGNGNNFASERECEARCNERQVTTTQRPTAGSDVFTQESCFLQQDPGPCSQPEPRWAYDAALGACTSFQYGGCGGNRNNFPSMEYCQYYCSPTQDICQLPMRAGPCFGSQMQWFYDASSDRCSQFTYGGCDGNDNRFNTVEECESRCRTGQPAPAQATTTAAPPQPSEEIPRECQVAPSLERCRGEAGAGVVWYLHPERRECLSHRNQESGDLCRIEGAFTSEESCQRYCGVFRNIDVCSFPKDPGPCRSYELKYYYDAAEERCDQFYYGGCQGGPNRFSSINDCEQVCKPETDPCTRVTSTGNCLENFVTWYYDESRDECSEERVYGGCRNTDSRFESREECEGRCRRRPPADVTTTALPPLTRPQEQVEVECRTPDSLEPCGDNMTVFYFDSSSRACVAAEIGGCRYPNSYRTEEECERRCGAFRGLDACNSPVNPGPCRAMILKVYWDKSSGQCVPFGYGGCLGGPNRFTSMEECEEVCGSARPDPACLQEVATGAAGCAEAPQRRWHYDSLYGECLAFVYSGCGGNDNNFFSYEQCEALCKSRAPDINGNEVLPDCDRYNEECSRLQCLHGFERARTADGCETCSCVQVAVDCSRYNEECSQLQCQYNIQRTRTADGCERCSCVQVEIDCEPLRQECERLKCIYGVDRVKGEDGCERCRCIDHPCSSKECPYGDRCVALAYRDPETQEPRYSADCRTVNKPGACPPEELYPTEGGQCRRECNDDADCRGPSKCCARGCSQLCIEPAAATSPVPRTTTYVPELPQAPQANAETEPEVTSEEGGKATLRCLFHGNPPPKITWRRGEITIDGTVGRYRLLSDGALEIVSLYRNDSGVYICVADNGLGTARQEVRLQVNDPVDTPAGISGEPNTVITGELGRSLNIRCLAYGYPAPAIYWYRGLTGPMVPFSSTLYEARGNVLQIRVLNLETLGEYACQAYNGIEKPASWSVVVQAYRPDGSWSDNPYLVARDSVVLVTPREPLTEATTTLSPEIEVPVYTVPVSTRIATDSSTVGTGSQLSLPCEVDGYPVPDVYWTKDGARLSRNDRMQITEARLTIEAVSESDSGVYGCHASNQYSSHYSTVQISVQGLYIPAKCTDNPFFANCHLIVRSKFCQHKYYSKFCCKSCVKAGQLDPAMLESMQADEAWTKRK